MCLLSRFAGDPTIRIRRDKKESRSTRRGLRVGDELKSHLFSVHFSD